jgi:hypothetical protein
LILEAVDRSPGVLVRCSSELPFYPGGIAIIRALQDKDFGQLIEMECGLLHSSDLSFKKPLNWKPMVELNGEYGCMDDLNRIALMGASNRADAVRNLCVHPKDRAESVERTTL